MKSGAPNGAGFKAIVSVDVNGIRLAMPTPNCGPGTISSVKLSTGVQTCALPIFLLLGLKFLVGDLNHQLKVLDSEKFVPIFEFVGVGGY